MRKWMIRAGLVWLGFSTCTGYAQETYPVNGIADPRTHTYAFTHATLVKDGQTTLQDATLVIREGRIIAVGTQVAVPAGAVEVNCSGKYLYPSLIDIYSDYGIPEPQRQQGGGGGFYSPQFLSGNKGAYGWNQAIHSETNAVNLFASDDKEAKSLRDLGFGSVLTHQKDGIARGTGAFVSLADEKANLVVIKPRASAHYSFSKGTSTQSYPSSMMGSVALLRQTYLDARWYKSQPVREGLNLSLEAWNENQSLPQIFEANDKWSDLRADRIGDEFGVQYIIKGGGNEYQRIREMAATRATFILPLNYPPAQDLEDPNDARFVSLADLMHWELAPSNPAVFEKAGIPFCLTTADLKDVKQFWANLHRAMEYGLSESAAFAALTRTPAMLLGVYDKVGSLEEGKLANFLITTGPLFAEKTKIIENWVQGDRYEVNEDAWKSLDGIYQLTVTGAEASRDYTLRVKNAGSAEILGKDTVAAKFSYEGKLVTLSFAPAAEGREGRNARDGNPGRPQALLRLSGADNGSAWQGSGMSPDGRLVTWTARRLRSEDQPDSSRKRPLHLISKVDFPFGAYGWDSLPGQETLLIRNATVWTNEAEGRLEHTDVLVQNGRIARIGKDLSEPGARVIDGSGKHLTPGIIDEHSHIAAFSINEGAQSVTSEVRIADNLNPEDINIYRQLSGGVTSSHILHGSANTIGGQTQLIKLRWGVNDQELKFQGADPFIKFALGENVKRTASSQGNTRYPDTRMGVTEVMMDAFTRARDYQRQLQEAEQNNRKKGAVPRVVRRDLELDALVEILNHKRFITCHSYVQSEVTATMRVAEKFGFRINTFTHILEGYKVADKMKAHGANASTFSDWWAYKLEVQDAIAYNASLMHDMGLNVCINSDDAEMARRLNQEAAKSVKYGGMSEEDALKMVTLNPARALHVEDRVGSIKVGKEADLVLWSDNPLSIYARAEKTIVDGIVYFDRDRDQQMRQQIAALRNQLIQKMIGESKRSGNPVTPRPSMQVVLHCEDYEHQQGILETDQINTDSKSF